MSGSVVSSIYASTQKRAPRARKEKDGQEKTITLDPLREKLPNLVTLHQAVTTRAAEFSEAVKAVAEETGLMSSVVRSIVAARAKAETFADAKRKAQQLALVFDEVGTNG